MRLQTARPGGTHMELPVVPRPESRYPQIRAVAFNSPPAALRQTIHPFCAALDETITRTAAVEERRRQHQRHGN